MYLAWNFAWLFISFRSQKARETLFASEWISKASLFLRNYCSMDCLNIFGWQTSLLLLREFRLLESRQIFKICLENGFYSELKLLVVLVPLLVFVLFLIFLFWFLEFLFLPRLVQILLNRWKILNWFMANHQKKITKPNYQQLYVLPEFILFSFLVLLCHLHLLETL